MEHHKKYSPISIWIGTAQTNFDEYIDQDTYGERCGFCQDIGQTYDEDLFSVYVMENSVNLEELIVEIPFSESFEDTLLARCEEMGITTANACISLLDEEFDFTPHTKNFAGLRFIGTFNYDLPEEWFENNIL